MYIAKTKTNSIQVLDAQTGNLKLNLPINEKIDGNAQIQGDNLIVQVKDGNNVRTKVYDCKTGNLKLNIS